MIIFVGFAYIVIIFTMMMNWYNFYFESDGTLYVISKNKNYAYITVKTIYLHKLTLNIDHFPIAVCLHRCAHARKSEGIIL